MRSKGMPRNALVQLATFQGQLEFDFRVRGKLEGNLRRGRRCLVVKGLNETSKQKNKEARESEGKRRGRRNKDNKGREKESVRVSK